MLADFFMDDQKATQRRKFVIQVVTVKPSENDGNVKRS
jgi:hypothetical protein